ncbi:MAG: spore coat protein H [Myxococcota bacterium]|jgi:spore coat protein H
MLLFSLACQPASTITEPNTDTDTTPVVVEDTDEDTVLIELVEDWETEGIEGLGNPDWDADYSDEIFRDDIIHDVEITLDSGSVSDLSYDPTDYTDATLSIAGQELEVGVRIKGSSSFQSLNDKPSLKFDMDFEVPGQTLLGIRKLNMHNMYYDPSRFSEELTYGMFRAADLPAARTGYARVSINGTAYGLYSIVEVTDDPMLERWFDDNNGNLYENAENYCDLDDGVSCFDAEETDEGSNDALSAFIDAVTDDGPDWLAGVQPLLLWDDYTGFLAMEMSVAHWDSYSYDLSNYRFYHEPTEDGWTLIPSSVDLSFGFRPWSYPDCGKHGVDPGDYTMGILSSRCLSDAVCAEAVHSRILDIADQLEEMDTTATIEAAAARIRADVYEDNRSYYDEDKFEEHIICVTDWLYQRPDELREWVADQQ